MDDWDEKIKKAFDVHVEKRVNITTALNSLMVELRDRQGLKPNVEQINEYPLVWRILIQGRCVDISEEEIDDIRDSMPSFNGSGEKLPLLDGIKKLLVEKFN